MQRLACAAAVALALAVPLAARAASCNAPGTCELRYASGRWIPVPRGHAVDLSRRSGADGANGPTAVVIDVSRDRDESVIDGSYPSSVNRVVDSVMWNRQSVDRTEVWTRAPRETTIR